MGGAKTECLAAKSPSLGSLGAPLRAPLWATIRGSCNLGAPSEELQKRPQLCNLRVQQGIGFLNSTDSLASTGAAGGLGVVLTFVKDQLLVSRSFCVEALSPQSFWSTWAGYLG